MKMRRVNLLLAIFFITAFLLPAAAGAADAPNMGFRGEVSPELKERFGMCDEFLDVRWVDRARRTGLLKVDAYRNGKKEPRFMIVRLEKPGTKAFRTRGGNIFYEISEQEYNSPAFAKFLAGGSQAFRHHVFMYVTKGKKSERYPLEPLPFEAFDKHRNEFPNRSFTGFSRTVCLAYPGEKQAFIVETKKPFATGSRDKGKGEAFETLRKYARERCSIITKGGSDCDLSYLKDSYALNINRDGKDDYIFAISGSRGAKTFMKRYMLVSSGDGYVAKDISGCLGFGRFFYGYADARAFHPGGCVK